MGLAFSFSTAWGQFTLIPQPTPSYTSSTALVTIPGANFSSTSTLTDGTQTFTFSGSMSVRTVPGGGWATWNSPPATESATPKVLYFTGNSLQIDLSTPATVFGAEVEPNFGTVLMTVTYYNGSTVLGTFSQNVVATSGALLAAASTGTPITKVVVTGSGGFALAQFRYSRAPVGTPISNTTMAVLACLLVVGGAVAVRKRQATSL